MGDETRVLLLGGGLVGGPMAADLAAEERFAVTVADRDAEVLDRLARRCPALATVRQDLSEPETVSALAREADLVLSAVPGDMGCRTLRAVLEAGRNVVDIAFFPEDPFDLDDLAREKGVIAVVDCGVAPGLSNLLVGRVDAELDETERVRVYVGGLPERREPPFEYKAVFSPIDVIAEYTRPARYVLQGRVVERPALSERELLDFPEIGELEAFNTDGLRTLLSTISAPDMREKTLRYPGHAELMEAIRETGLFGTEPVEVRGAWVRPIDLTAKLLFPMWKLEEGEADLTVLKVVVEGKMDGRERRFEFDLLDRYDEATGVHSMARTTGYTATMVARLLADGLYSEPGITPPEKIGRNARCAEYVLKGLADRGVVVKGGVAGGSSRP